MKAVLLGLQYAFLILMLAAFYSCLGYWIFAAALSCCAEQHCL
jgi:hypothetical protein